MRSNLKITMSQIYTVLAEDVIANGPLEVGDIITIVFNDAVATIIVDPDDELDITIRTGKPNIVDLDTNLKDIDKIDLYKEGDDAEDDTS